MPTDRPETTNGLIKAATMAVTGLLFLEPSRRNEQASVLKWAGLDDCFEFPRIVGELLLDHVRPETTNDAPPAR